MEISDLSTFLVPLMSFVLFFGGLFIYWLSSFFLIYHLIRFGVGTTPKRLSFVYFVGSIALSIFVSVYYINLNIENIIEFLFGAS